MVHSLPVLQSQECRGDLTESRRLEALTTAPNEPYQCLKPCRLADQHNQARIVRSGTKPLTGSG